MKGFEEFEFDLPQALQAELIAKLDKLDTNLLVPDVTKDVPDKQGIYQLFHRDKLVYIGKTDADSGLRTRLTRHSKKIKHRPLLDGHVYFKAMRIMVFTTMDLESQLIDHYRSLTSDAAAWNGSGFGANDPGSERETTKKKPDGFDVLYPIDIDIPANLLPPGLTSAADALMKLKATLPYLIRYESEKNARGHANHRRPHPDLIATSIVVPEHPQTVRSLMTIISSALGDQWQATLFASHIILYKRRERFEFGQEI